MTAETGLDAAEAAALASVLPQGVPIRAFGAGLAPEALLQRFAEFSTKGSEGDRSGLVLLVIPSESLLPPADPAKLPSARALAGAGMLWLLRQVAPVLAPNWRLNAVSGLVDADTETARACLSWLAAAPSVTGQVIALDGLPATRGP